MTLFEFEFESLFESVGLHNVQTQTTEIRGYR